MKLSSSSSKIATDSISGKEGITAIIKSGSCLAQWQIEANEEEPGKNLQMDFQLSEGGVLAISGNTLLSSVPAPGAVPYYDEPEGSPSGWSDYVSPFENLDFHTVIIAEGVRGLGEQCFRNCKGLRKLILPEKVPVIRKSFADGSSLEYKVINGLKFLGPPSNPLYYLMGCEDFFNEGKLEIPEGTIRIANEAFKDKKCIKEVVFPSSLEFAGWFSFEGTSVRAITIPDGKLANEETLIAFDGAPGAPLETISLPFSLYRLYKKGLNTGWVESWNRTCRIVYRNQDDTVAEILDPTPTKKPEDNASTVSSDDDWIAEMLNG